MTIDEFFNNLSLIRAKFTVNESGRIRDKDNQCPICTLFGGKNSEAYAIALEHGISRIDAASLITGADFKEYQTENHIEVRDRLLKLCA